MLTQEQAKKIKWYKQSGAGTALLLYLPLRAVSDTLFKRSGFFFPNQVAIFLKTPGSEAVNFYHYFDYELTLLEVKKIFEKVDRNPEFFENLAKEFYLCGEKITQDGYALKDTKIDTLLINKFQNYLKLISQWWATCLFIDLLDPYEDEIVNFVFGEARSKIEKRDLGSLFAPNEFSIGQREQIDFLKIAKRAKERGVDSLEIEQLLLEHSKKYFFISNDYETVRYLDCAYFKGILEKKLNDPKYVGEVELMQERFQQSLREKQELIKKYQLSKDVIRKLEFFNWVTTFRDDRKKYMQISSYFTKEIFDRIGQENKLSDLEVKFLLPSDLPDLIARKTIGSLSQRIEKGIMFLTHKEEPEEIIFDNTVAEIYRAIEQSIKLSEIKGNSASRGKTIGTVRIILGQGDFSKMQEGDILIAPMTRPEYIPIMKLAKAVITDEGGITCHAAIVSRELGIPCITGTQVATKVLCDGDLIDIDANHGLIKIINKAA